MEHGATKKKRLVIVKQTKWESKYKRKTNEMKWNCYNNKGNKPHKWFTVQKESKSNKCEQNKWKAYSGRQAVTIVSQIRSNWMNEWKIQKHSHWKCTHAHTTSHYTTVRPLTLVRSLARLTLCKQPVFPQSFYCPLPFSCGFSFPYVGFLNPKIPYLSHILFGYTLISVIHLSFLVFFL